MKIAVFGAGGVGGYFGGRLAQSGQDVTLIARGKHLQAIRENGLSITTPDGSTFMTDPEATDNPAECGVVDAVIVAVKGWQLPEVARKIQPLLGDDTMILPLLNGVSARDLLSNSLNSKNVLNGLCGIIAQIEGPGQIRHVGIDPFIKFGEADNARTDRVARLTDVLSGTGANVEVPDDINRAMWLKYIFIAPLSGVTAISRSQSGVVRAIPETRQILSAAIAEAIAVGQAAGIDLKDADLDATMNMIDQIPADGTTSMQRDIEAGFPSELETQTGTIVTLGSKHGVATPINDMLYAALLPQEQKSRSR